MNPKADPRRPTGLGAILASAFGAGDGTYAWKKEALPAVLETLPAENLAVVGGEIWGIRGFEILPAVPTRSGHTRIFSWSAPDKAPGIGWPAFVNACARYARRAILELDAESLVVPSFRHRLVYHLPFFSEQDYPAELCRANQ